MKKLTTQEFIEKAIQKHGDKYDYSQSEYITSKLKVKIGCKIHGIFPQIAQTHLSGAGCPTCGGSQKLTTESFVERAKEVHNNFFDYSKVKYVNAHSKVQIICPKHGEFPQRGIVHLNGHGCPACSGVDKLTTEKFIKKSK